MLEDFNATCGVPGCEEGRREPYASGHVIGCRSRTGSKHDRTSRPPLFATRIANTRRFPCCPDGLHVDSTRRRRPRAQAAGKHIAMGALVRASVGAGRASAVASLKVSRDLDLMETTEATLAETPLPAPRYRASAPPVDPSDLLLPASRSGPFRTAANNSENANTITNPRNPKLRMPRSASCSRLPRTPRVPPGPSSALVWARAACPRRGGRLAVHRLGRRQAVQLHY